MDEHVGNPRIGALNRILHRMRDVMAFAHGNVFIYANVKIDVKAQSHFADETFFDLRNARHRRGRVANGRYNFTARRRIHDFAERRPE